MLCLAGNGVTDAQTDAVLLIQYDANKPHNIADSISASDKDGNPHEFGTGISYDDYIPDLVTNLNFNGNTEMKGNIIGSDNMKMTVHSGTLRHDGSADVVNVKVNQGATLLGGSYTVNDMSSRMAEGFRDDTTGKFINHGTIGALNEDSKLGIDGTLESDGRLLAYNGYQEQGSIKAYGVEGGHNTYAAAEAGMEFTRFLPKGSLNFRLGVRQALMGADYQEQDASRLLERSYSKSSRMDRTHFVTSLATETEFQTGWQLSTELGFQKGAHDKDIMASIQFRRLW